MLVYLNESTTGQALAINPDHIITCFEAAEGELEGKTIVVLTQGSWTVSQSQLEVVGMINGLASTN